MSLRPADSWYEATARRDAPLPSLEGDIDADVCVVGAGLSGCSTAMHLAQRGYKVVVLEAERIGYGASGRSGGQIIPGWAGGMDRIAAQLGKADAKRIWDFSLEGVEMTRELIEQNRIDCELAWGHMHVALKPRQLTRGETCLGGLAKPPGRGPTAGRLTSARCPGLRLPPVLLG